MPKNIQYDDESDKAYQNRMQKQAIQNNRQTKKEGNQEPPVKNYERYNRLYEGGQYPELPKQKELESKMAEHMGMAKMLDIGAQDPKPAPGLFEKLVQSKNSGQEKKMMAKGMSGTTEEYQDLLSTIGLYKGKLDGLPGPQTEVADSIFTMLHNKNVSVRQMKLYSELRDKNLKGEGPHRDSMFNHPETFKKWYNKTGLLGEDEYLEIFDKYAKNNAQVLRESRENLKKKRKSMQDKILNWINR
jgi:hypothetical protein